MSKQDMGKDLLENAYRLQSPDDNIAYYDKLANSYDNDFAEGLGYALPQATARRYRELSTSDDSPVADVGCGTGLLADALELPDLIIDGLDISEAMLAIAKNKRRYRQLYAVDLTQSVDSVMNNYGAVLSSGTFTHGHLGPDALVRLLAIAKRSALFILSINKEHFVRLGFASTLDSLTAEKRISDMTCAEVNIYRICGHEHSDDVGLIVSFRKN